MRTSEVVMAVVAVVVGGLGEARVSLGAKGAGDINFTLPCALT